MEAVIANYTATVKILDDDLVQANENFKGRMEIMNSKKKKRVKNVIKTTLTMMKTPINPEETCHDTTDKTWWQQFKELNYPDNQCLKFMRCSRKTYKYLIEVLSPHLVPRNRVSSDQRNPFQGVSVDKQVALVLSKLTNRDDLVTLSSKFAVPKTTAQRIVHKVVVKICQHLLPLVIKMPDASEAAEIAESFEKQTKFPQIIGLLDTLHVPVYNASGMANAFVNSKLYYSFIAQMIIDSKNCFRDVSIRHPGATTDIKVLTDSNIYRLHKKVIPPETQNINGFKIPYCVIGPCSYPLLPWILTEYTEASTDSELLFNAQIDTARQLGKTAIKRMRARFDIINHPIDISIKVLPQLIGSCFALHNICERLGDFMSEDWLKAATCAANNFDQPEKVPFDDKNIDEVAGEQRDCIKNYFSSFNLLEESTFGFMDYQNIDMLTEEVV
ncbi:uncharacterized protein LOC130678731 [Microplitis mediator]|uniref:uncharacterized protein LOC130678731 n=1 Tax=Microplitis mediator TaxID=375433 RepID=UPI002552C7CA|nr:uncharacterized protein LOC130678731 [Microplitis mediator]